MMGPAPGAVFLPALIAAGRAGHTTAEPFCPGEK